MKAPRVLTPAEEIWHLVQEYAAINKIPIPLTDVRTCLDAIKEEKKALAAGIELPPPSKPSKPEYGSPEFWKAHWEKKKASGWVPKEKVKKASKPSENTS